MKNGLLAATIALAVSAVACGGGGSSPSSPSNTPSPSSAGNSNTSTPTVTTSGVFTFTFPAGTSAADQSTITTDVAYANSYFQSTFGHSVQNATQVMASTTDPACSQGGAAAATTAGKIIFCTGNAGWMLPGAKNREKITMHETFHLLQFEEHWLGNPTTSGPDWIIEGAAEFVGFHAAVQKGLFAAGDVVGCMVKQVNDFALQQPPGLKSLQNYENQQVFSTTMGPLYPLSYLGIDLAVGTNLPLLRTYGDALASGTIYNQAFANAFGQQLATFYSTNFPAYYSALPIPTSFNCGN